MPDRVAPMLASTGPLPADDAAHGYEVKWDGIRTVLFCDRGEVRLQGRRYTDYTRRYPEVCGMGTALERRRVVLDGEVVAFDPEGRPSFERLQARMHLASDGAVRRRLHDVPATYVIFDVLHLDGASTMPLSYEERRALLAELGLEGPGWRTPAYHRGGGRDLLDATERMGVEGVVAKRLDCPYEPGRRSSGWVKVKNLRRQEVVIGGFTPGAGSRGGRVGALAVGYRDGAELVYAGKVGTGFTESSLALVKRELDPLARDTSPFSGRQPPKGTRFVEPRLVAHVEFREWTKSGTLRAPSFKGVRPDISPQECVREEG